MLDEAEQIIMTPKGKTATTTTLLVERKKIKQDPSSSLHVAGGEHKGIVINKNTSENGTLEEDQISPDLSLSFRVFLVNSATGGHTEENRTLSFWFKPICHHHEKPSITQEFFQKLVHPKEFPRDYVGFIKKIMKLMQNSYPLIQRIQIELKLQENTELPQNTSLSKDEHLEELKKIEITEDEVLKIIESSYPNPITVEHIAKERHWDLEDVKNHVNKLQEKLLVKSLDHGGFTRIETNSVQVVKQMPIITKSRQPTIAIITAQYCEKVAVDALIGDKETFVRYTTVGESNVYTLGNMGPHRIVCTKLPTIGHTREAMTAAGNTITRLLGTFQDVDHVFLVGIGGGVPHYTDYSRHVRLGDVVVSHVAPDRRFVYTYCDNASKSDSGVFNFECKEYCPSRFDIQETALQLKQECESSKATPWVKFINEGSSHLDADFVRPPPESDKLYMCVGEHDIIEVAHPSVPEHLKSMEGVPRLHLGPIASGRAVLRDEQLRQAFALRCSALAFDSEFDSVIESVIGNCRECFAVVRGVADYRDGTRRSEWQGFAALAAASVTKAIVCAMNPAS
uniref:Winged helix-turn-helix domain-containing protein n=1 Tax=Cacopsylla melanoneura TaxID=428564 RepID=A0A8D8ZKE6_9HEMI